jgi:hypothetical protein
LGPMFELKVSASRWRGRSAAFRPPGGPTSRREHRDRLSPVRARRARSHAHL